MSTEYQSWYDWWYFDPTQVDADPHQAHLKHVLCLQIQKSKLRLKHVKINDSLIFNNSMLYKIKKKKKK